MRFLAFLTSAGLLVEQGYVLVVIVLAQHMHASSTTIGLIFGLAGASGVVASFLAAPVQRRIGFRRVTILTHWVWTLSVTLFVVAPTPLALALVTALAFGVTPFYGVAQYSYRLSLIPDSLQGRVNSVFRLALYTAPVVGQPLAGVLLQWVGPTTTVWIFAGMLALVATSATLSPQIRHAEDRA
jgi:predicted MFS family arabinose efflux permease